MATNTVTWIVVAVVVLLLVILLLAFVGRGVRDRKRRAEAGRIREEVREESGRLEKREAIAAETEARARAAQAEAEAKAAEAVRLQDRAATHRSHVDSSREDLDARRERADALDPRKTDEQVNENNEINADVVDEHRERGAEHPRTVS
jgi:hypothetical protein